MQFGYCFPSQLRSSFRSRSFSRKGYFGCSTQSFDKEHTSEHQSNENLDLLMLLDTPCSSRDTQTTHSIFRQNIIGHVPTDRSKQLNISFDLTVLFELTEKLISIFTLIAQFSRTCLYILVQILSPSYICFKTKLKVTSHNE